MDFSTLNAQQIYKLFIGSVVPRPIAWVSTLSEDGVPNLAPFSYFNIASINPPILSVSILNAPLPEGGIRKKDTLLNLQDTGECVIHIVSHDLTAQMSQTSANFPPDVSEFEVVGLKSIPATHVRPPRLADAKIAFEGKVHQIVSFGEAPMGGNLCLIEIVHAHFGADIERDFKIDLNQLDPVARLGGDFYSRTKSDVFELSR